MRILCTELHRFNLDADLDIMTYASTGFNLAQFCVAWIMFLVAKDGYRSVRYSFLTEKQSSLSAVGCQIASVVISAIFFHIPYLPHFRVVAHQLHNMFDPCVVPAEQQWNFVWISERPSDLYYPLYYCLFYLLFVFGLPCLLMLGKCKAIADFLYNMNHHKNLPSETINCAISSLMILALMNVYLVMNTPKIVVLLFRMFNYHFLFMLRSYSWFHMINLIANMLMVLRPAGTVLVMLRYNARIRQTIMRYGCFGWRQIQRTRNSIKALGKRARYPSKTSSV